MGGVATLWERTRENHRVCAWQDDLHLFQMQHCLSNFLMTSWEVVLLHPYHLAGVRQFYGPVKQVPPCSDLYHVHPQVEFTLGCSNC